VSGWIFFLLSAYLWWHVTDDKSVAWFFYQEGIPLAFMVFTHAAALLWRRPNSHSPTVCETWTTR
jgi:hypothetical protein